MADKNLSLGTIFTGRVDAAFDKAIKELLTVTKGLNKEFQNLNRGGRAAARGIKKLGDRAKETKKEMAGVEKGTRRVGKQLNQVRGVWERLTAAMKVTAAYGIAAAAMFKVVEAVRAGIAEIINYDQALKNLQAITGATGVEIEAMGEAIEGVATRTKFSTTEIAEGMVLLGQAGFSATESMQAIQATADLATGTLASMQFTADLLTTTIRAFGLEAIEATRVADVMANAINKSKLTIDKLRIAFNFVGAAAAMTGLTLEQTAASMMLLANHGLRASTIGTGLRQVLSRLLAPSRKLKDAFESHGIALERVNPSLVGYEQSMMRLAPILFDSKKKLVDMAKAYELFGLRGAQAAAVIIKSFVSTGANSYDAMLEKVYELGAAAKMAAKQAEGLGVKLKNLADRAKIVAIAIGDAGLGGVMRGMVDALREFFEALADLIKDPVGRAITQFIMLTGVMYAFNAIIVILGPGIASLSATMYLLYLGLNKWLLIIPAVVAVLGYLMTSQERVTKNLEQHIVKLKEATSVLSLYGNTLEMLRKKYAEGEDVTNDYLSTLKRLMEAYPDLRDEIELTIGAWEDNARAIEKAMGKETENLISSNLKLIERYRFELQNMVKWAVLWQHLKNAIMVEDPDSGFLSVERVKAFEKAWKELRLEGITEAWKSIAQAMHEAGDPIEVIIGKLQKFGVSGENLEKVAEYVKNLKGGFKDLSKYVGDMTDKLSSAEVALRRRYLNLLYSMETGATKKIWKQYAKRLADANKYYDDKMAALKKRLNLENREVAEGELKKAKIAKAAIDSRFYQTDSAERRNLEFQRDILNERITVLKAGLDKLGSAEVEAAGKRGRLILAAQEELDRNLLELQNKYEEDHLNMAMTGRKIQMNEMKKLAFENAGLMKEIEQDLRNIEIQIQEERVVARLKTLDTIRDNEKSTADDILEAWNALAEEVVKLQVLETKGSKRGTKDRIADRKKELRYLLDNVKRTGDAYVAILQEAYDLDLLNLEEHIALKTAATGTWVDNLNLGLEKGEIAALSFNEVIQEIGEGFADEFANNLTSGLFDFIDGTKSAEEAFDEFAKSTLRWMAEMIIKWAILKAMGFAAGASADGGGIVSGGYGEDTEVGRTGGIVGSLPVRVTNPNIFANAKHFQEGGVVPGAGAVPIIAHEGEGIFTPEQMQALGKPTLELTQINVTDQNLLDRFLATARGRKAMINFMGRNSGSIKMVLR